jgi:glycogen debranching enzyme
LSFRPVWGPSTYIAVDGLERSGFPKLAKEICRRFCALCKKSGFAENFDALSGAPLRDPAYTWTSSAFLLMLKRLK